MAKGDDESAGPAAAGPPRKLPRTAGSRGSSAARRAVTSALAIAGAGAASRSLSSSTAIARFVRIAFFESQKAAFCAKHALNHILLNSPLAITRVVKVIASHPSILHKKNPGNKSWLGEININRVAATYAAVGRYKISATSSGRAIPFDQSAAFSPESGNYDVNVVWQVILQAGLSRKLIYPSPELSAAILAQQAVLKAAADEQRVTDALVLKDEAKAEKLWLQKIRSSYAQAKQTISALPQYQPFAVLRRLVEEQPKDSKLIGVLGCNGNHYVAFTGPEIRSGLMSKVAHIDSEAKSSVKQVGPHAWDAPVVSERLMQAVNPLNLFAIYDEKPSAEEEENRMDQDATLEQAGAAGWKFRYDYVPPQKPSAGGSGAGK